MAVVRYLLIAGLLFLSSCSSGGGRTADSPVMPGPPAAPDPMEQLTALATANQAVALAAASRAASSLPLFGDSITQSGNQDDDRVSSDSASTAFDGAQLTATIAREGASPLAFDTATDTVFSFDIPYIPGYTLRTWALLSDTDEGASVSYHVVNWNNADSTDYLAAGYWIHLIDETQSLHFTSAEAGVFVDGPELSTLTAPVLPDAGKLTFSGPAQGFYIGRYGAHPEVAEGSTEYGEFSSSIRLTADFDEGTIHGCMGCPQERFEEGFRVSAFFFVDGASGEPRQLRGRVLSHQIHLQAPLSMDGTFRPEGDGSVTVMLMAPGVELTESSGTWGGKFSTIQDAAGAPRLVAGTVGTSFKSSRGGEGAFLGTFVGLNQP